MDLNKPKVFKIITTLTICLIILLYLGIDIKQNAELKENISKVNDALNEYYLKCQKYPTTDEGILLLTKNESCLGKALLNSEDIKNGFNNDFIYISNGKKYRLISLYKKKFIDFKMEGPPQN